MAPDAFDRFNGRDSEKGDAFDRFEVEEESAPKSFARTLLQIPQGIAEATPPGLAAGFHSLLAQGEVNDPEDLERIRAISEREGIPFDEEGYKEAGQRALGTIPTVSNIGSAIEDRTGIPLEPKTRLQKGIRLASTAGKAIPKPSAAAPKGYAIRGTDTGLPRPVLGAAVAGTNEALYQAGVPEVVSNIASFGIIKPTSAGSGQVSVGQSKKESGLTNRQYEKLKNPREVDASTVSKINEKTEKEFRDLTNKIIEKSPSKEVHENLLNDASFKKNAAEAFEKVEELSKNLPKEFSTQSIKKDLANSIAKKKNEGLTPSEFDKAHNKFLQQFIEETPEKAFTSKEIVEQFRKNNKQLSEAYEPGQSFAYNRAKREALQEYNSILGDMIEREYPNSEFSKLFKETNKRWSDISNVESIHEFLDNVFKEKIDFKSAKQLFTKNGMTVPFKRALGKEGFAKFETLLNDLMSTEKSMKLLKSAKDQGYGDLAKTGVAYLVHPNLAGAKLGYEALKGGYKKMFDMILDKPQLAVTWDRGINAFKRGDFKTAEKEFSILKAQDKKIESQDKMRTEALKKFNEKKSSPAQSKTTSPTANLANLGQLGAGISDSLYSGIFQALKEGKNKFAGVSDSLLIAAKPSFDAGLINSAEDLRKFADYWQKSIKNNKSQSTKI